LPEIGVAVNFILDNLLLRMPAIKPILRIFDYSKAVEFYVGLLGFNIDWEHTFGENSPVYMQISLDTISFHLSEHHGDSTPGTRVFIEDFTGLKKFHKNLSEKKYKYNKPGVEKDSGMKMLSQWK